MPKIDKKFILQARIDKVINILNAWVYYDSDVPLETKEQIIRIINILLKGEINQ